MPMIQMFFDKHESIDIMCNIFSVELDKLKTWFALSKLLALNSIDTYARKQIFVTFHLTD